MLRGSSDIGLAQGDYDALNPSERATILERAAQKMRAARAHDVIESLFEFAGAAGTTLTSPNAARNVKRRAQRFTNYSQIANQTLM